MKRCYHCMQQISNEKARTCPKCGKSLEPEPQKERFLKAGTVLGGKFIAGYPLGAGGFGNTYIGWDKVLCRKVAIKEFYPKQYSVRGRDGVTVTVADERLRPRFQRGLQQFLTEARNVAALHEVRGVVEITNFFEENGTGYLVMEYLEGMDVREILKRSGNKKEYEWCRRVILTVLYTLREIHRRGVLHRDIAPDNIFVTDEGIIKLIDFGAAKQESALDNTSDIMLKEGYAPIEQYSREIKQGPYTDIYAVAALFYRMLTGQKPISARERLKQDSLIPPSAMGISIPEQAEFAIMICLNLNPKYRLQSAGEFMEALDGKFFVPVYEPEWILPPVKEKKGLGARIASLSVAAKVALCVGGICLAGGVAFGAVMVANHAKDGADLDSHVVLMQDMRGKSGEEAAAYIEQLNREHFRWEIRPVLEETVFDLTKENDTVCEQSIEPGSVLYDPDGENAEKMAEGLEYDGEGKLTGTVSFTVCSHEKLRYGEISGMNAYALAKKLGIDTSDQTCFVEEKGKQGTNYFDLAFLETAEGEISEEELCRVENSDKELTYSPDIKIHYYATDFFYWDSLPDFAKEYGMVDRLPKATVFRYVDENVKTESGSRKLKSLVDDSYFAIRSDENVEGKIIGQTVAPGERYDGSAPGDTLLKIEAIGTVLDYTGKTGTEFIDELKKLGFGIYGMLYPSGQNVNDDEEKRFGLKVEKVEVYRSGGNRGLTDEKLEYFQQNPLNDDEVFFVITVKEPPKVTIPSGGRSSSGGSSSGGSSSGGSYSGGGSSSGRSVSDENGRGFIGDSNSGGSGGPDRGFSDGSSGDENGRVIE